jgi:acetyl-CoA carboxylase carboxyltransferase component
MGVEGAVNIIYRDRIAKADDPERVRAELTREYRERYANPYEAASRGYVDEVILPRETRPKLIAALEIVRTKRDTNPPKKHGNIPL